MAFKKIQFLMTPFALGHFDYQFLTTLKQISTFNEYLLVRLLRCQEKIGHIKTTDSITSPNYQQGKNLSF